MNERWTVYDTPHRGPRNFIVEALPPHNAETAAHDIAARLNGPSPAEVATLLHSVEWSSLDGATEGSYGHNRCPSCEGFEPDHEPDCKLAAMIKQCEGA